MSLDPDEIAALVARHGRVARVVVAQTAGSIPREVGAAMLVWQDGQAGTIGGGALELEACAQARRAGASFSTRHALGPGLGQCCGGAVTLATEIFDAGHLPAAEGTHFVRSIGAGAGAGPMPLALRRMLAASRAGQQTAGALHWDGTWLAEPMRPARAPLWIWGAGHVGRALVAVIAPLQDYRITWIDSGTDRFPGDVPAGVTALPVANPADAVALAPAGAHHLILTYSHALDLEICHRLLCHGFASAGLIGSATKWARFRGRLAQLGHQGAQVARIVCPIGDPALGKQPQAIAVGVAARLLSERGSGKSHMKDAV